MSLRRGLMIDEKYALQLCNLPEKVRAQVLGLAFSLAYGLAHGKIPQDSYGILTGLAQSIADCAGRFETGSDQRKSQDALRKWLSRHPGKTESDYLSATVRRTETDKSGQNMSAQKEGRTEGSVSHTDSPDNPDGRPTLDAMLEQVQTHFGSPRPPREFVEQFRQRMEEGGWHDSRGRVMRGSAWLRELSAWWAVEQKNVARAPQPQPANAIRPTGEELYRD